MVMEMRINKSSVQEEGGQHPSVIGFVMCVSDPDILYHVLRIVAFFQTTKGVMGKYLPVLSNFTYAFRDDVNYLSFPIFSFNCKIIFKFFSTY